MENDNLVEQAIDSMLNNGEQTENDAFFKTDSPPIALLGIEERVIRKNPNTGEEEIISKTYDPVMSVMKLEAENQLEKVRIEEENKRMVMQQQYEYNLQMLRAQNQFMLQQQMFQMANCMIQMQTRLLGLTSMVQSQQLMLENPGFIRQQLGYIKERPLIAGNNLVNDVVEVEYEVCDDNNVKPDFIDSNQCNKSNVNDNIDFVDDDLM